MPSDGPVSDHPACDFCHARKIKCDRHAPCDNCIDARVECRRDRPRKSRRRPKGSRIPLFNRRLSALERAAAAIPSDSDPVTNGSPSQDVVARAALRTESTDIPNTGPSGRQPSSIGRSRGATSALQDGLLQQTLEGTRFLQRELESNMMIGQDRSVVLRRAIDFVSRISSSGDLSSSTGIPKPSTTDRDVEPHKLPPELLYMMTMNSDSEPGAMNRSFWPDHVSLKTLENMCLSIIEENEDEQTLICYRICVYMKAITLISRLPGRDRSARVRRHLEQSKSQYDNEIHRALSKLDFLAPPNLHFLQALLSAALFMQNQGDMSKSWTLTAFASRTLVCLKYHTIDRYVPSDGEAQDVYGALYVCYYLDKILSVLLLRPPSLPKLKVTPADMVRLQPQLPLSACVKAMVCLGQVQEGVLDVLFNRSEKNDQVIKVNALVQEMYHVRAFMDEPRCQTIAQETYFEWLAIEFGYHALLASVFHLQQRVMKSPLSRQECLHAARQSLVQLTKLQDEITIDQNFLGEYPYFLTWTLLFFPLSPYFVVFCNVIYTTNTEDYTLLSTVTSGISRFSSHNRSVAALHKLFSAFLDMCEPLFNSASRRPDNGVISSQSHSMDPTLLQQNSGADTESVLGGSLLLPRYNLSSGSNPPGAGDDEVQNQAAFYNQPIESGTSDSELMWDLLQSQPWLGWIGSDA